MVAQSHLVEAGAHVFQVLLCSFNSETLWGLPHPSPACLWKLMWPPSPRLLGSPLLPEPLFTSLELSEESGDVAKHSTLGGKHDFWRTLSDF